MGLARTSSFSTSQDVVGKSTIRKYGTFSVGFSGKRLFKGGFSVYRIHLSEERMVIVVVTRHGAVTSQVDVPIPCLLRSCSAPGVYRLEYAPYSRDYNTTVSPFLLYLTECYWSPEDNTDKE